MDRNYSPRQTVISHSNRPIGIPTRDSFLVSPDNFSGPEGSYMLAVFIDRAYRDRGLNGKENDTIRLYQVKKQKGLAMKGRTRTKILSYED